MSKRKPTTDGVEWLYLSMASFNGSGYADKSTAQSYLDSYTYYKAWKKDKRAVEIVRKFPDEALTFAEKLMHSKDPGHTPNNKFYKQFLAFIERAGLLE